MLYSYGYLKKYGQKIIRPTITALIEAIRTILAIISLIILTVLLLSAAGMAKADNLGDAWNKLGLTASSAGYAENSPEAVIAYAIQIVLSFVGVVFLILMIYGGFLWMTARGVEEQVTKAKNIIIAAIIGLIIVIAAYAISYFVIKQLGVKTLK